MHKSTTRNTRKKILILAAASLLAAPSFSLPAVHAEQTSVSATSSAAEPATGAATAAPAPSTTPAASAPTEPEAQGAAVPSTSEATDGVSGASKPAAESAAEEAPGVSPSSGEADAEAAGQATAPAATPTKPASSPATKPAAGQPAATPAAPEPFYDIVNDPNRDAIMTLYNEGIVKAAKDRKFRPKAEIGRADFTVILGRAMKANGSIFDVYFTDPIPDWAIRYVGGLSAAGIYEGYLEKGDRFGPKLPVTRAEAAAMVARAAHLESQPLPEGLGGVGNIPVWALDDVGAAYAAGLIEVTSAGTLNPNKKVTRSEMAAMIAPLLEEEAFMTPIKIEEDITLP
ncbi:S-layer homology domain-containing protein [Saccharibacillus sacchari]|uniref:S-layer homology domain-containing protein n=1 Tax=Saccharibacillus sacchari TaxID=456493 RepID=UPI0004ACB4A8|nr:S-layer homology domain-containing protein [Saccharibacillus sacchari]